MSRNKFTGEKSNPKPWRRHQKVVDQAIREQERSADGRMASKTDQRYDSTFAHLHKSHQRWLAREGR
jgi:hypothetical protein